MNYLITDKEVPLEGEKPARENVVGKTVEISYTCGNRLTKYRGKPAKVLEITEKYGEPHIYTIMVEGKKFQVATKDLYINRKIIEDAAPITASSELLKNSLSHWGEQRDYWTGVNAGLEAICFAVASTSDRFRGEYDPLSSRFQFSIPSNNQYDIARAEFPFYVSGNFWYTSAIVTPDRLEDPVEFEQVYDHWERVFQMGINCCPYDSWRSNFEARREATRSTLVPLAATCMKKVVTAYEIVTGERKNPAYSIGFSKIRLPVNKIGLNDPPTDIRPYAVMSVSPGAAKDFDYLEQVVLHECVHVVVGKIDGKPHNDVFNEVARLVGIEPDNRD